MQLMCYFVFTMPTSYCEVYFFSCEVHYIVMCSEFSIWDASTGNSCACQEFCIFLTFNMIIIQC